MYWAVPKLFTETLSRIRGDGVEKVIVLAPLPLHMAEEVLVHPFASVSMRIPCFLPLYMELLSKSLQAKGVCSHSDLKSFWLAAWKLSSRPSSVLAFPEVLLAHHLCAPDLHCGGSLMAKGEPYWLVC